MSSEPVNTKGTKRTLDEKADVDHLKKIKVRGVRAPRIGPSLADTHPHIAKEWHSEKNGDLTPLMVSKGCNKIVYWTCEEDHVWSARIASRQKSGCPHCKGCKGLLQDEFLGIYEQIHIENCIAHGLKLETIQRLTSGSGKVDIWWSCKLSKCEHQHSWCTKVVGRVNGEGCPDCAGKVVCSCRSLGVLRPDLASQLHPTRNGKWNAYNISPTCGRSMDWVCTDKICDCEHIWTATVDNRYYGSGCPYCCLSGGNSVTCRCNSLLIKRPEWIAQLHPTRNGDLDPSTVPFSSSDSLWWLCICSCGRHHEWEASPNNRKGCGQCSGYGKCTICPCKSLGSTNPELASEINHELSPVDAMTLAPKSDQKLYWNCIRNSAHPSWIATVGSRNSRNRTGCPSCNESKLEKTACSLLDSLQMQYSRQFIFRDHKRL
jgi:Probable Zinc-ribbon domain